MRIIKRITTNIFNRTTKRNAFKYKVELILLGLNGLHVAVCSVAPTGWARTQVGFSVTCVICCTGCSVAPAVAAPQTEANYQLLRRRRSLSYRSYSVQETSVL